MAEIRSPNFEKSCSFTPINLHDPVEKEELTQQRITCGWHFTAADIEKWRKQLDAKEKTMFWISLPWKNNVRAGHISLDSLAKSENLEIQNLDKSIMTIKTFFILPEYRTLGLGRKAMDVMEQYATTEPHGSSKCRAIVVDTISKKYARDPDYIALREELGLEVQYGNGALCNEEWYERRGYVKWKEENLYQETNVKTGEPITLLGVWMWKDMI